jgi:hypothetical protein
MGTVIGSLTGLIHGRIAGTLTRGGGLSARVNDARLPAQAAVAILPPPPSLRHCRCCCPRCCCHCHCHLHRHCCCCHHRHCRSRGAVPTGCNGNDGGHHNDIHCRLPSLPHPLISLFLRPLPPSRLLSSAALSFFMPFLSRSKS